jgi:hypothetical protein
MRTNTCKIARTAYSRRGNLEDPIHRIYKDARNRYAATISKAKLEHWENFLENVNEKSVWTAHRFTSGTPTDGGKTQAPTLKSKQSNGTTR